MVKKFYPPLSPEEIIFHNAARNGKLKILKAQLDKININSRDMSESQLTALHKAVMGGGHINVVKFLVKNGALVNTKGKNCGTPLHIAAREGTIDIVNFLIENGANIDEQDEVGLTHSCWNFYKRFGDCLRW